MTIRFCSAIVEQSCRMRVIHSECYRINRREAELLNFILGMFSLSSHLMLYESFCFDSPKPAAHQKVLYFLLRGEPGNDKADLRLLP
jgi:hypothetical protein